MKAVAIFNNKGGVGKTTLTYHAASALSELGHKTLLIDLDPQSNLTLYGESVEEVDAIWSLEESFIDDFESARASTTKQDFQRLVGTPRSAHFLLKPTEDGTSDFDEYPPPKWLDSNLALITGRLSLHMYEDRIASRWSDAYRGDPLAIRTIIRIRRLCEQYARIHDFQYILVDTSPSLGILNKVIISTLDGFLIPCGPDVFSLYGIRNIGRALSRWKREFETMYQLLSTTKRADFPSRFVQFLGFTIYNARKYAGQNEFDLASAHYTYARQIPGTIEAYISEDTRSHLRREQIQHPIGGTSVMHTHNTLPNMAQKYRCPIWRVPDHAELEADDVSTIRGNKARYKATQEAYAMFVRDLLDRLATLE
jgi:cellulose biosynthesis protein BcsQ